MTKSEVIQALVANHFNFTFEGDNKENRTIIFTKDNFRSTPIFLETLSDSTVDIVKTEFKNNG